MKRITINVTKQMYDNLQDYYDRSGAQSLSAAAVWLLMDGMKGEGYEVEYPVILQWGGKREPTKGCE